MSNATRVEILTRLGMIAISGALSYYIIKALLKELDPSKSKRDNEAWEGKQLLKSLNRGSAIQLTDYELSLATHLIAPDSVTTDFSDIGGLDELCENIRKKVILPMKLLNKSNMSPLLQPPKGVLLYGPPGCGKTMIAKATAKASGVTFLNFQVSHLMDKWYGESQKLTSSLFSLACKLSPSIIFIDEIDSFLRERHSNDHEVTAMVKGQFMSLWDGLNSSESNAQVLVLGATNRPQDLDPAFRRRMPLTFHISLPNQLQRADIFKKILSSERIDENVDMDHLSEISSGFSGSDIKEVCREAVISKLNQYFENHEHGETSEVRFEGIEPVSMKDISQSILNYKSNTTY